MISHPTRLLRKPLCVEQGDRPVQAEVAGERFGVRDGPAGLLYGATGASHGDFTRPAEYTFAART